MRYTTLIDITEFPRVYKNHNARLVYLHMVLKSGYHAEDKDQIRTSIRRVAMSVGLTVSATRHALAQLERDGLLQRIEGGWSVRKWVLESYPKQEKPTKKTPAQEERERQEAERIRKWHEGLRMAVSASTREELEEWLTLLKNARHGKAIYNKGVALKACDEHITWLTNVLNKR